MPRRNRHAAMIEEGAPLSTVSFPIDLRILHVVPQI